MKTVVLAEGGKTDYRIVVSRSCSSSENHAAKELKYYLNTITNAHYDLVTDEVNQEAREILIGESKHLARLGLGIDYPMIGDEGFIIKTNGLMVNHSITRFHAQCFHKSFIIYNSHIIV